jgi:hypothetical protein
VIILPELLVVLPDPSGKLNPRKTKKTKIRFREEAQWLSVGLACN